MARTPETHVVLQDAYRLVREIVKKWDFAEKTTLPEGVVNSWKVDYDAQPIEMRLQPRWKKTGVRYKHDTPIGCT